MTSDITWSVSYYEQLTHKTWNMYIKASEHRGIQK